MDPEEEEQLELAKVMLKRLCRPTAFDTPVSLPSGTVLPSNLEMVWKAVLDIRRLVAEVAGDDEGRHL